ncbi:hypothetical protein SAMN06265365_10345 [Tistlia consotensis]|uniref:Uncharacterized protein n=1 Tax=Tistlia consotensis USBA 355 TaxID=560819 RepID=A0A1Y6BMB1_9PROT|nr:hypothetical protein [Tistlia consotensis]SMF18673.1 hypothetical protein SAMN05428998_106180 [Tistlia consotensis USBA 355]SNR39520.1 hypothetical protein SAMN06265365_10345 [Tistlia consotensis]
MNRLLSNRLLSGSLLGLLLASGAGAPSALLVGEARAGVGAEMCQAEVTLLHDRIDGESAVQRAEQQTVAGITDEDVDEPQSGYSLSPPGREVLLGKLDRAAKLAAKGDGEGCRALVEQVRRQLGIAEGPGRSPVGAG